MDVSPRIEHSQVFVAGDNELRLRAERTRKHGIIIGIATNLFRQLPGGNELREAPIVGHKLFGDEAGAGHVMRMLFAMQDLIDLGDEVGAGEAINLSAVSEIEEARTDAGP